jgi:hypothetical protein
MQVEKMSKEGQWSQLAVPSKEGILSKLVQLLTRDELSKLESPLASVQPSAAEVASCEALWFPTAKSSIQVGHLTREQWLQSAEPFHMVFALLPGLYSVSQQEAPSLAEQ